MKRKKKEQLKREAKKFSVVGSVATVLDYGILNCLVGLLHFPVIGANLLSTTLSSFVSYRLNKKVVFEGRRHRRKKAIALYALIVGVGIYVIQNGLLYLFQKPFMPLAESLSGMIHLSSHIIALNMAKIAAGCFASLWNYFMLRHFVFIPETQKEEVEAAE